MLRALQSLFVEGQYPSAHIRSMSIIYVLAAIALTVLIWFWLVRLEWKIDVSAWRLGTRLGESIGARLPMRRGGAYRPSNRELSEPADSDDPSRS